jgi:hypothetical protein
LLTLTLHPVIYIKKKKNWAVYELGWGGLFKNRKCWG